MVPERIIKHPVQLTREEMLKAVEGNISTLEDWDDIADAAVRKAIHWLFHNSRPGDFYLPDGCEENMYGVGVLTVDRIRAGLEQ